ncbi:MAG: hypothetical protein ACOC1O_01575 [bacterium]
MNIGLDLDNTLIDTNIVQDVLDEYGVVDITYKDINHWDLRELPPDIRLEVFKRYKIPEYNCNVNAIKGVKRKLNIWKRLGHNLIIITSRPTEIENETIDMVKKLFPCVDKVIIVPNKEKKQTLISENIDVFVDDAPHHIDEAIDAKVKYIYLISNKHTPYNYEYKIQHNNINIVKGLEHIFI